MKKIFGLVLALVLLVSALAILPVAAEEDGAYLYLDDGITFVNVSGNTETRIPVAAKEIATKPDANKTVQDCLNDYITGDYPQVTKDIAKALLDYCTAAYDYFSTKSEKPYVGTRPNGKPETDASELISELINAPAPEVIIDDTDDVYLGAALVLDGNMKLRFYFNGNNVNVEHDGNSSVTPADGYCYYDVAVMPFDMDKSVELTVGNTKIKYAPINYLKAKVNDDDLKEIVASIYAYGDAAEKYIREVCQHGDDYIKLDIVKPATLFTKGEANTVCERCGQTIDTDKSIGTPKTEHYTSEEHGLFGEKVELSTLLGAGEHFYGEDAKKLYVEFSLLWNPSLENYARENNENYMYMGMFAGADASTNRQTAFHLAFAENCPKFWCKYIGGFEPDDNKNIVYGEDVYSYPDSNGKITDFPNIGNYGWHRIGYEFEQTTDPETGLHTITVYLYIDGVKLSGYKVIRDKDNSYQNLLYTATVDENGAITYTGDVKSGVYMWAFALANGGKADGDMYFTYADVFVTAGDGFVMPVEKVSDPKYATYTVDTNVSFNASTYFKPVGDDTCAHENTMAGVTTTAPTLFATGEATAICTYCGKTTDGTVTLPQLKDTAVEIFTPGKANDVFGAKVNIVKDVLKGDHFYPTEGYENGKSMYVEFSILWNKTLENVENKGDRYVQLGVLGDETASSVDGDTGKRLSTYFILFKDGVSSMWCKYAGGIETDSQTNVYGPTVKPDNTREQTVFVGEYGWHRIGIEYTQETDINGTNVNYTLYATLYIDGVKKMSYKAIYSGNISKYKDNLLYTYDVNTGEYTDIATDRYVYAYRFGLGHDANDESAYFVAKDAEIYCGTGFKTSVKPIDNPTEEYFTKDNVNLYAGQYFVEGTFDCDSENHAWASKYTVDKAPTCTEAGSESIKCLACGKIRDGSSLAIPANGEHTWGTKYTVDEEATCKPGKESIKCTVCGTTKPGSTQDIPAIEGKHVWPNEYTVVTTPTAFSDGTKTAICTKCDEIIRGTLDKVDPTVVTFSPDGKNVGVYKNYNIYKDVLNNGKDHFYPTDANPDGKSLYIEFSILWNDTLENVKNGGDKYVQLGTLGDKTGSTGGKRITPFFLIFNETYTDDGKPDMWCQYNGGFETDNNKTNIVGPKVDSNLPKDGYTYIGDYGWHRIGIKYTQTHQVVNGTIEYTLYTSLYVDGVEKLAYKAIYSKHDGKTGNIGDKGTENLLYTYDVNTGKYTDIADDRYAFIYRFANDQKTTNDENAYYVVGDISVTCGTDFVLNVKPLKTPTTGTYSPVEGADLSKDVYFDIRDLGDCEKEDHTWSDEKTVDVPATCAPGSKSAKCVICGEKNPDSVESIDPTGACVWENEVIVTAPTIFADGYKTGNCANCGAQLSADIDNTAKEAIFTDASPRETYKEAYKISDILNGGHFYPTEDNPSGQDLYVEFSLLWNESLENFANSNGYNYIYMGMIGDANGADQRRTPYHLTLASGCPSFDCQLVGGFEPDNTTTYYGPKASEGKFVSIGDYGWHRIGIQLHQTSTVTSSNVNDVKHTVIATLYIDGVKVHSYPVIKDLKNSATTDKNYKNLLYTAKTVNWNSNTKVGSIASYNDGNTGRYILPYMVGEQTAKDGTKIYFITGDLSVTAGDDFVMQVEPNKNPTEASFVTDDEKVLDGTAHYQTANDTTVTDKTVAEFVPSSDVKPLVERESMSDILDGGHFYPDAENGGKGRDLYVEFSFLWNPTLANYANGDCYAQLGALANADGASRLSTFMLLFRNDVSTMWCQFAGGFESDNSDTIPAKYPQTPNKSTDKNNYAFIGEYGWHRIGIHYHQDVTVKNNAPVYTLTTTIYVDGVDVLQYQAIHSGNQSGAAKQASLLYTAKVENGEIVGYEDNNENRYVYYYRTPDRTSNSETFGYMVVGDMYANAVVTPGAGENVVDGFVMDVEAKSSDEIVETTGYIHGVEFDTTAYFKVKSN